MNILHLTDFHVNKDNHQELNAVFCNVNDAIKKLGQDKYPDTVLMTGDLTETGNQDEYKWFREEFQNMLTLESFREVKHIMMVPGNHDFSWEVEETRDENFRRLCSDVEIGLSEFDGELQEIKEDASKNLVKYIFVEEKNSNVLLIGMNSMKKDSKEMPGLGYFSKEQFRIIESIVEKYQKNTLKKLHIVVAFHHHILPVSVVEQDTLKNRDKYSLTLDARRAINTFLNKKIEYAVHGHQHQASMVTWKDDERSDENVLHVISAGCLAGKMYAGDGARNSFMLYAFKDDDVIINKAESSENDSEVYVWKTIIYPQNDKYSVAETSRLTDELNLENSIIYQNSQESMSSMVLEKCKAQNQIDRERILTLAEQGDQWINWADQMGALTIKGLVGNLVDSIAEDGSVSYEVNIKGRYRTSTLATVLECMDDIRLLPNEDLSIMQHKLLSLKNDFSPLDDTDDVIKKDKEDLPAWGIDEAPSVWTTSKALSALFVTKFNPSSETEINSIAESVDWLANQAYDDGGWGYQKFDQISACASNVPMTALAMKSLGLALKQDYLKNKIKATLISNKLIAGLEYLKKNKKEKREEKCFWQYDGKENLSATIWALEAWKIASEVVTQKKIYYTKIYEKIKPITLKYVVEKLPEKDGDDNWTECFFRACKDDGLKYKPGPLKKDKAFYSFTPYIISYIIKEDNTFVENCKIISVIKWVLAHRDDAWLIPTNYNSDSACTISVAMAINVIVNWLKTRTTNLLEKDFDSYFM